MNSGATLWGRWIRLSTRMAIYNRDGFACCYCGAGAESGVQLTLDHVTPRELGGDNRARNLVTACMSCNCTKRDMRLTAFMQVLADRGIDANEVRRRVRNAVRRKLDRAEGRRLAALRRQPDND